MQFIRAILLPLVTSPFPRIERDGSCGWWNGGNGEFRDCYFSSPPRLYRFRWKFENRPSLNRHLHPSNHPDNRFIVKERWITNEIRCNVVSNIIDEKIINFSLYIAVDSKNGESKSLSTKIKHVKLNSIPRIGRRIKITDCQLVTISKSIIHRLDYF